jgi:hypothetical protein
VDLDKDMLINHTKGIEFKLQGLGDAGTFPYVESFFHYVIRACHSIHMINFVVGFFR